jgi:hypothetical protein
VGIFRALSPKLTSSHVKRNHKWNEGLRGTEPRIETQITSLRVLVQGFLCASTLNPATGKVFYYPTRVPDAPPRIRSLKHLSHPNIPPGLPSVASNDIFPTAHVSNTFPFTILRLVFVIGFGSLIFRNPRHAKGRNSNRHPSSQLVTFYGNRALIEFLQFVPWLLRTLPCTLHMTQAQRKCGHVYLQIENICAGSSLYTTASSSRAQNIPSTSCIQTYFLHERIS